MTSFNRSLSFLLASWASALLLAGCGGGGGGGSAPAAQLGANEHVIYVDAGPPGTGYNANRLYTDVTICQPGSATNCQTIDHVLVDSGSTGLRILSTVLNPGLGLPTVPAPGGRPLLGCVQFVDNTFAWGPIKRADVVLGAKRAANLPVEVIADPSFAHLAANCSSGTNITSATVLGANGVLGIGLFTEDCGVACESNPLNRFYYTCADPVCFAVQGTTVPRAQQAQNPVAWFAADNNGVAIELPFLGNTPTRSVSGKLVFGVGTQPNNQPAAGRVLAANVLGHVTTVFEGRAMTRSFIDSGSNALFFDTAAYPLCPGAPGFYCPPGLTPLNAVMTGANGVSIPFSFTIDNALATFVGTNPVLPNLAGTFGDVRTFDWGLPFFLGRKVYFGIEGRASSVGTGPFYAY
jgi:Protein of unknown function (DUF3443)